MSTAGAVVLTKKFLKRARRALVLVVLCCGSVPASAAPLHLYALHLPGVDEVDALDHQLDRDKEPIRSMADPF